MKHQIASPDDWLAARRKLLAKEKEFSRLRDELSADLRQLPWVAIDKDYVFQGADGSRSLADLFAGRSQLITYHFMYGPDWEEGCPSCSLLADGIDGTIAHLNARDVTFVVVSRAPLDKLNAYRHRMGWSFPWVSSLGSDFNFDFAVSFDKEQQDGGEVYYNYRMGTFPSDEAPGISVFYRDGDGTVYHTYSAYARGLDRLIGTYHYLDLVPKGRDEASLPYSMAWVRRHDQYDE